MLKPYALAGLTGLDPISHATIWTMLVNVGLFVGVSLVTTQSLVERSQAVQFVDIFKRAAGNVRAWRGRATVGDLKQLLIRFLGEGRADAALARFEDETQRRLSSDSRAHSAAVSYVERQLAASSGQPLRASWLRPSSGRRCTTSTRSCISSTRRPSSSSTRAVSKDKSRELEAATADLRAANERLKELDKLKDDFLATVSHEVRTPLTSIRSFSEILRDNPELESEQRLEFVNIIVQESERLSRLINDILDLAKMEAGRTDWTMSEFTPKSVIEQAVAAATGLLAREQHISLETRIADGIPPIRADADRLTQIIVNLISNAVKFSAKESALVRLEARQEDAFLRVDVKDNGIGIAAEDQEKIFERFQQAGNVLTDKPQGTGLGLPICRQILQRFGGDIWVTSTLGYGSTFSFRIPLAHSMIRPQEREFASPQ